MATSPKKPPTTWRVRRQELVNLGTVKQRRSPTQALSDSGFFGDDRGGPSTLSQGQVSKHYDGCATDLIDFADEPVLEAGAAVLNSEDELAQLTKRGLYVMGDPVNRALIRESERQIIENRGDVIGSELVDELQNEHARIQGRAWQQREFHFAPDQPLVSRYAQELRNEELMKREHQRRHDLESINESSFFDDASGDSPTGVDFAAREFGPKISFQDPIQGRKSSEEWLSAEDIWTEKRKEQQTRGDNPVEVWGVQRAPKTQLEALNNRWEQQQNFASNKHSLDFYRHEYRDTQRKLQQVKDPARKRELEERLTQLAAKGKLAAKNIDSYRSKSSVKPGEYDAPNGPWSLDDMNQRVFRSKAEAEGWINVHSGASPDVVLKPYKHELSRTPAVSQGGSRTIQSLRKQRQSAAQKLAALKRTNAKYITISPDKSWRTVKLKDPATGQEREGLAPEGKQRVAREALIKRTEKYIRRLDTQIENRHAVLLKETGQTGREFLQMGWHKGSHVFRADEVDKAREFYANLRRAGHKPKFRWLNRADGIAQMDRFGQRQTAFAQEAGKTRSMIALSVDGKVSYYDSHLLPTLKRAATSLKYSGKAVKLNHVRTDAPATPPLFAVRQQSRIEASDGEQVPYTWPVTPEQRDHFERLFAKIDGEVPTFVSGRNLEQRTASSDPDFRSHFPEVTVHPWVQSFIDRNGLGV